MSSNGAAPDSLLREATAVAAVVKCKARRPIFFARRWMSNRRERPMSGHTTTPADMTTRPAGRDGVWTQGTCPTYRTRAHAARNETERTAGRFPKRDSNGNGTCSLPICRCRDEPAREGAQLGILTTRRPGEPDNQPPVRPGNQACRQTGGRLIETNKQNWSGGEIPRSTPFFVVLTKELSWGEAVLSGA